MRNACILNSHDTTVVMCKILLNKQELVRRV